jgi:DNA-binding LacI/PurR family transcriptional regulator
MPTLKKLTIHDIARLAGVSITTVSRVINDVKVGKDIREKVLGIIQQYGYCPDPHAQYLGHQNHSKPAQESESAYCAL